MAEPLKDSFGPDVPVAVAAMIAAVEPDFDADRFVAGCLDGYDDLELTPRARKIADVMAEYLPDDRRRALLVLTESLGVETGELSGMDGFRYLPHVYFVADYGLEHFEESMTAQYELTKRFTAEFSIRAYVERYPDETLARLRIWAVDPNVHVRRLVSEGTRPRLPWAPRLRGFQHDPAPVLDLLEVLKDDPKEYVRRSVANNLNDISKDHPELVVDVAARWWEEGGDDRRRLVRHGLRTLIKRGDADALAVLGFSADSAATVAGASVAPPEVAIGGKVAIAIDVINPSDGEAGALVDLRIHFVKSNGSTSPKVFKGAELHLPPGDSGTVRKTVSVRQHSTRAHYPGAHRVDALVNGVALPIGSFELLESGGG
ncbi:MAG: DNA alkylation repair protein [Ilumatobacteraceae bacterium]